jgi:hypothetical protein
MTMLLPRRGIGIAVYLNLYTGSVVPLAYALAATLIGMQPPRDWTAVFAAAAKAVAPPPPREPVPGVEAQHPLAAYAGVYEHPADGELRIEVDADGLRGDLVDGHAMTFRLAPLGDNEFALHFDQLPGRVALLGFRLVFDVDAGSGQAHTVVMHLHTEATRVFKLKPRRGGRQGSPGPA